MEKLCSKCKKILPIEKFAKNKSCKSGYRSECKDCHNLYFRQYFADKEKMRKQSARVKKRKISGRYKFDQYKLEQGCKVCGYNKCPAALHFHHLNGKDDKRFLMSKARNLSYSIEDIEKEIDKCIIVCSNCHAEIHAGLINLDDLKIPQTSL